MYTVWEKLSRVFQTSTKVDEIQETYRGMTIACEPSNWAHIQAWSLPQLADFLLDAGRASEFEVFPQAATLPQEEETTGELLTLVTVIFLQQGF